MNRLYSDIDKIDLFMRGELREKEESEVRSKLMEDEDFWDLFGDMVVMIEGIKRSAAKTSVEEKLQRIKNAIEDDDDDESSDNPFQITW